MAGERPSLRCHHNKKADEKEADEERPLSALCSRWLTINYDIGSVILEESNTALWNTSLRDLLRCK
jgi:hypothetical protein